MAHWNNTNTPAYFVKLLGVKEKKPFFELSHKVEEEYVKEQCSFIEGTFDRIEKGTYEREWKPRNIFKLNLKDNGEKYILNFSYTQLSRGLLNSLLWAKELNKIRIEVRGYVKEWVAKNAIKVLLDWEKAERSISYDDMMMMVEVIKDSNDEYVSSDYKKLDKYLMDKFDELNNKKAVKEEVKEETTEDNDLPFN